MSIVIDQIWIDNRTRYRKGMAGTGMRVNPSTGYLESPKPNGFSSDKKKTFIERFTVCKNKSAICKSIPIDIQSVYDAVALDSKFRTDFIHCETIKRRKNKLNDALVELASSEKVQVIAELTKKMDKYCPEHYA